MCVWANRTGWLSSHVGSMGGAWGRCLGGCGAVVWLMAWQIITPIACACLVAYRFVKAPYGWGIQQVYGGLILELNVSMRK
jgi:hypothetical protein